MLAKSSITPSDRPSPRPAQSLAISLRHLKREIQQEKSQDVPECPKSENTPFPKLPENSAKPQADQQLALVRSSLDHVAAGHALSAPSSSESELEPRQQRALQLILEGVPIGQVAETVGVDRRTVYRWRRRMPFRRELDAFRRDMRDLARDRIHLLLPSALEVIQQRITSAKDGDAYRASAFIIRTAMASEAKRQEKPAADPLTAIRQLRSELGRRL